MAGFNWKPLLLACLIVSIGQLSLGLVFPTLPAVALSLHLSTEQVQLLVSGYLFSFGASQLIFGPLSDVFGRRPVLLSGLLIAACGLAVGVLQADSFHWLLIGRIIQGMGAGSVAVLARATIRDSYQRQDLVKAMTWLAIVAAFTPIMAPVIGGIVNHHFGWLTVFVILLGYIAVVWLLLLLSFSETLATTQRPPSVSQLAKSYLSLIQERHFLSFAGIGWVNFALVVLSISMMPFIMQVQIGMSSERYALWAMGPAFGLLCGGLVCQRLRPRLGTQKMLMLSPLLHFVAGSVLIAAPLSPIWMVSGHFLMAMANGIAFPCAQSLLLVPYGNKAGTVSALSGACQMVFASLLSNGLLKLGISEAWHLGGIMVIGAGLGLLLAMLGTMSESGRRAVATLNG
ncbi:multidrug effflux MFS transporter [Photobacterium sp. BZF1]|uniref:multidrug effflux MFS transporter n=1 Tax=Photobacterium sp. BZF1 TaxID=1904457 RepID=UPI00165343C7|nr:multidrug effflux MFS transporter [Photobacterium sp. BZF1]MBC7003644.1 multidrug effflux MFS transporter [Photobacterium sp. BZF1]